jgi:hypothetical protein
MHAHDTCPHPQMVACAVRVLDACACVALTSCTCVLVAASVPPADASQSTQARFLAHAQLCLAQRARAHACCCVVALDRVARCARVCVSACDACSFLFWVASRVANVQRPFQALHVAENSKSRQTSRTLLPSLPTVVARTPVALTGLAGWKGPHIPVWQPMSTHAGRRRSSAGSHSS